MVQFGSGRHDLQNDREEPIIYIDGIEPELKMAKDQGSGNSRLKCHVQHCEETATGVDDVANSAEGASKEALPGFHGICVGCLRTNQILFW